MQQSTDFSSSGRHYRSYRHYGYRNYRPYYRNSYGYAPRPYYGGGYGQPYYGGGGYGYGGPSISFGFGGGRGLVMGFFLYNRKLPCSTHSPYGPTRCLRRLLDSTLESGA